MLDNYIKWFKAHEFILAVISVLAVTAFIGRLWINRSYDTALAKNSTAQQVLKDQVAKDADTAKRVDALEQSNTMLQALVQQQNASLLSAIAARNQTVTKQQNTDRTLPLSDLAARQQSLVGLTEGISTDNVHVIESPAAAIVVTQKLETLPALEQNVTDLQTLANNKDKQITSLGGVVDGLNGQVAGLNSQLVDSSKACQTEVKLEVAKARKSKIGWFKAGAVVGFVAGLIVGHHV